MGRAGTFLRLNPGRLFPAIFILLLWLSLSPAEAEPLRVLSQNMNRLFDDIDDGNNERILSVNEFRQRINSAARKFGDDYRLPHIIALQEVENLNVLSRIATEIHDRHAARYRAILIPGQDISGINLAYLVRFDVDIRKLGQLFREQTYMPDGQALFSRPPLYLEACHIGKCLSLLNLHLRSMRGIDSTEDGQRVRRKRLLQAESIAGWSDRFQKSRPRESLLLLGDFNALTPSDRHVDVIGIIRGSPDNRETKLRGRDLVEADLLDLTKQIPPARRYSFVFRQKKQQLDYMLVNRAFAADVESIAFSRIDYQFSDHAGLLARFDW